MNQLTICGYIAGLEMKQENDLYKIKFSICDQTSETNKMWFACYLDTKKESTFKFMQEKIKNKQPFTVIGKMFYNYNAENEKTYINIKVQNFC